MRGCSGNAYGGIKLAQLLDAADSLSMLCSRKYHMFFQPQPFVRLCLLLLSFHTWLLLMLKEDKQ